MDHALQASTISVVSACVVVWGLLSARLEHWDITGPIAFVVLGLVVTHGPLAIVHVNLHSSSIRAVAEITLAIVLFADACRVNARALRSDAAIPLRLLGIALPLTIGAGTGIAFGLFSSSGIWLAATIGAIVAPTDAALGASMISDDRVPPRVRRILNVESGLNDGIATPFVNLFLAGAIAVESITGGGVGKAAVDLAGGAAVGAGIGITGAVLLRFTSRRGWSGTGLRPLAVLALAVFAFTTALAAGTNGFISAFVAGLAFGTGLPEHEEVLAFSEEAGTLLSLLVWFSFGAVMLVPGFEGATWRDVVLAVLALSVVRMVPVAVSLARSGLDRTTVSFIGWFGPRGLASVVFGLIAVDSLDPADAQVVLGAVVVTIAMSVAAHGASAAPLARRYGATANRLHPRRPEHQLAPALSIRTLRADRRLRVQAER
jgi:sodium/hydrogen antiporter